MTDLLIGVAVGIGVVNAAITFWVIGRLMALDDRIDAVCVLVGLPPVLRIRRTIAKPQDDPTKPFGGTRPGP